MPILAALVLLVACLAGGFHPVRLFQPDPAGDPALWVLMMTGCETVSDDSCWLSIDVDGGEVILDRG